MTRFARAKGSKASNERLPEDGTQWSVMKQQMEQTEAEKQEMKKRKEFEKQRQENYQAFLAEQKQPFTEPAWAEFSDNETSNNQNQSKTKTDNKKNQKLKKNKINKNGEKIAEETSNNEIELKKKKVKKNKVHENGDTKKIADETSSNEIELKKKKVKKNKVHENGDTKKIADETSSNEIELKKKKGKKNILTNEESNENSSENDTSARESESTNLDEDEIDKFCDEIDSEENVKFEKLTKKIEKTLNKLENGKSNTKKRKLLDDNLTNKSEKKQKSVNENIVKNISAVENGKKSKKNKMKKMKSETVVEEKQANLTDSDDDAPVEESIGHTEQKIDLKIKKNKSNKNKKLKIDSNIVKEGNNDEKSENTIDSNQRNQKRQQQKEKMRRKPESNQKQYVLVDGEKQEIVMYAGFPVKKSDAERLQKLKEEMIKKGIPREEVFHTMKLERRKAEKALTRDKKRVCFQCRQSGHLLSDCPQIGNKSKTSLIETSGTDICYKCGSTEHTSFNCRVVRDNTFKFAKCFICGEQGHLSRQCPDNPRGLYPQGGGCRICGDVTHLKKDCPQFQQKQEDNTITLNTLTSFANVEDDFTDNSKVIAKSNVVKPKIVKF